RNRFDRRVRGPVQRMGHHLHRKLWSARGFGHDPNRHDADPDVPPGNLRSLRRRSSRAHRFPRPARNRHQPDVAGPVARAGAPGSPPDDPGAERKDPRARRPDLGPGEAPSRELESAGIKPLRSIALSVRFLAALPAAKAPERLGSAGTSFSVVEATIPQMRAAMEKGQVTSRDLVLMSLARIATYEDKLHAAITVNPNALKEAEERDQERRAKKVRGPLHGIPIAVKDNIQTTDMPTTGGALVFDGFVPPYEATVTK